MSKFKRFATKDKLVEDFDWSDNAAVIRMFRDRIIGWYFEPIEQWPRTGHEAFVALLAVRQVIVTCAEAFYGGSEAHNWKLILAEVDPEFYRVGEIPGTFGQRFLEAVFSITSGELRMSRNEGISGTGRVATETEDGVLVFDPWVVRDRVRAWFEWRCDELLADTEGKWAKAVCDRLREAFTGGDEDGGA